METGDKRDPSRYRRAEDAIRASAEGARLANAALALLGCADEDSVYRVACEFVSRLCPGSVVVVDEVTPDGDHMTTRVVCGLERSFLTKLADLLGFDVVGKTWPVPPGLRDDLLGGDVTRIAEGFAPLTEGVISPAIAEGVAAAFGVVDLYVVGISDRVTSFGNIAIVTRTPGATVPASLIETFARHAFSAIENLRRLRGLRESEERFAELFEQAPLGYQSLDEEGRFLQVNEAWLDILGYPREEVVGAWFGDFLAPEYVEPFRERFPLFKSLGAIHSEFEMVRKDGTHRFIAFDGRIGHNPDGTFKQTHCILADVTEARKAEAGLRESEERLRLAVQNAPIPMMLHAEDGEVLQISDEWTRITGYSLADIPTIGDWTERAYGTRAQAVQGDIRPLFDLEKPHDEGEYVIRAADGAEHTWHFRSSALGRVAGGRRVLLSTAIDVTDLERAESALRESERRYRAIAEVITSFVYSCRSDPDTPYHLDWLAGAVEDVTGYTAEEVLEHSCWRFLVSPEDAHIFDENVIGLLPGQKSDTEFRIVRRDGTVRWVRSTAQAFAVGDDGSRVLFGACEDITARRDAVESVRENETRYRTILQTAVDGFWVIDARGRISEVNDAYCRMSGYSADELLGLSIGDVEASETPAETVDHIAEILELGHDRFETRHVRKDGSLFDVEISAQSRPDAGQVVAFIRDITESKRAARALVESEEWLAESQRIAQLGHYIYYIDADRWDGSDELYHVLGVSEAYVRDFAGWLQTVHPAERERMARYFTEEVLRQRKPFDMEYRVVRPSDGVVRTVHGLGTVTFDADDRPVSMFGIIQDVTEASRADRELHLNAARTEALLQLNQMVDSPLQAITDFALENAVRLTESTIGYLAFLEEDGSVLTMHSWSRAAMAECAMTDKPLVYPLETTGLWGEPVRQRKAIITNDYVPGAPLTKGYPSGHVALHRHLGVPIFDGDAVVAVVGVGNKSDPYNEGDVRQLTLLMEGMWHMASRAESAAEVVRQRDRAEKALESVIEITRDIVEERDPYTSGHQRRVAEVAVRIAHDLGMSDHEIEHIRIAALLHDVGKVAVPSEILAKPGTISPTEYELLKSHAEAGHRILMAAGVEEPLPELVWQHHERCDGSGYPRGLTEREILPGAKILAVADVLEAMTSHRPYRPALGIDAALAELEHGSGTLYDPAAVSSCLALFREQGFEFD